MSNKKPADPVASKSVGGGRAISQRGPGQIVRSICLTMVKNEQDIIEPFLRHNRRFFDAMIVLDNRSADRTRDIVVSCARELGGIIFADLPRFDYAQADVMTLALHHAQAAFFADFVCFLDADEFIGSVDRLTFDRELSSIPFGACSSHPWQTFLHDPEILEVSEKDPLKRMTYRRTKETPLYRKVFLRLGGAVNPYLKMTQGNHAVSTVSGPLPRAIELDTVPLLHFPIRSANQLSSRGVIGWMANLARGPHAKLSDAAFQWKRIYELSCQTETPLTAQVLANEGMAYAQVKLPARFQDNAALAAHEIATERRHSDGLPGDPFKLVAAAWAASSLPQTSFTFQTKTVGSSRPGIRNAFDDNWHWENLFLDVAPFRYLAEKYHPTSAFDVGCGTGVYLRLLQDTGVSEIFGVDGINSDATVLPSGSYGKVDLQSPLDLDRTFDIVLCLEVAEHILPDSTEVLIDTVARHARDLIVFSMAEPGQPGNGHINCRTMSEVLDLWARRGWEPDLIDTLGIRALSTLSWFRRNLLVLKRSESWADNGLAGEALRNIGASQYIWYGQPAGVRPAAFQEPYPDPSRAYGVVLPPSAPLAPVRSPA